MESSLHRDEMQGSSVIGGPVNSPLDRPIPYTLFLDKYARQATEEVATLRELGELIRSTRGAAKDQLPLIKLATFGDAASDRGSLRHDGNLRTVSGIEADYDAGDVSPEEAAERLRRAGLAALVYTTPSHRESAPRWRVLCPLAAPVAPELREGLVARLNGALGGILAGESFSRSQAYYTAQLMNSGMAARGSW